MLVSGYGATGGSSKSTKEVSAALGVFNDIVGGARSSLAAAGETWRKARQQASAEEREQQRSVAVRLARAAFDHGDHLLQIALGPDLYMDTRIGDGKRTRPYEEWNGPNRVLNDVEREGWTLISASFVQEVSGSSRVDSDGSIWLDSEGTTAGHYVFRRNAELRSAARIAESPEPGTALDSTGT